LPFLEIVRKHALGLALLDVLVGKLVACSLGFFQISDEDKGFKRKVEHPIVSSGLLIWQVVLYHELLDYHNSGTVPGVELLDRRDDTFLERHV
jgi:hypothetical protein